MAILSAQLQEQIDNVVNISTASRIDLIVLLAKNAAATKKEPNQALLALQKLAIYINEKNYSAMTAGFVLAAANELPACEILLSLHADILQIALGAIQTGNLKFANSLLLRINNRASYRPGYYKTMLRIILHLRGYAELSNQENYSAFLAIFSEIFANLNCAQQPETPLTNNPQDDSNRFGQNALKYSNTNLQNIINELSYETETVLAPQAILTFTELAQKVLLAKKPEYADACIMLMDSAAPLRELAEFAEQNHGIAFAARIRGGRQDFLARNSDDCKDASYGNAFLWSATAAAAKYAPPPSLSDAPEASANDNKPPYSEIKCTVM